MPTAKQGRSRPSFTLHFGGLGKFNPLHFVMTCKAFGAVFHLMVTYLTCIAVTFAIRLLAIEDFER
jgi:hypothetical protein